MPISQLKSLKIIDTVPNYQDGMASYLKHQLLLARSAIYEQGIPFRKQLQASQGHFDIENIQEDTWPTVHYRDLYTATQAMIDRLNMYENAASRPWTWVRWEQSWSKAMITSRQAMTLMTSRRSRSA